MLAGGVCSAMGHRGLPLQGGDRAQVSRDNDWFGGRQQWNTVGHRSSPAMAAARSPHICIGPIYWTTQHVTGGRSKKFPLFRPTSNELLCSPRRLSLGQSTREAA